MAHTISIEFLHMMLGRYRQGLDRATREGASEDELARLRVRLERAEAEIARRQALED
jgi:hypothetical protein